MSCQRFFFVVSSFTPDVLLFGVLPQQFEVSTVFNPTKKMVVWNPPTGFVLAQVHCLAKIFRTVGTMFVFVRRNMKVFETFESHGYDLRIDSSDKTLN